MVNPWLDRTTVLSGFNRNRAAPDDYFDGSAFRRIREIILLIVLKFSLVLDDIILHYQENYYSQRFLDTARI